MDGCRRTKRRIIDSTSVPNSRRSSHRQLDYPNVNNKHKTSLEEAQKQTKEPTVTVDCTNSDTRELNDDTNKISTPFSTSDVGTRQNTHTIVKSNIRGEVTEDVLTNHHRNGNFTESNTQNTTQKLKLDTKGTFSDHDNTTQNSHFKGATSTPLLATCNPADSTETDEGRKGFFNEICRPIIKRTIVADELENNTQTAIVSDHHENYFEEKASIGCNKDELRCEELDDLMLKPILDREQKLDNRRGSDGPMYSTSKAGKNGVRFSLADSVINISVENKTRTPDGPPDTDLTTPIINEMKINPLLFNLDVNEEDEIGSVVFSDMFETRNVCLNEMPDKVPLDPVHNNNVKIKFHEFFGGGDELSSIVDESLDSPYMNEGNIKCSHGLSLFDDPKTVRANSKLFKVSVSESNEIPSSKDGAEVVEPETKDPYCIDVDIPSPVRHNGSKRSTLLIAELFDVIDNDDNDDDDTANMVLPCNDDEVFDEVR